MPECLGQLMLYGFRADHQGPLSCVATFYKNRRTLCQSTSIELARRLVNYISLLNELLTLRPVRH